MQTHPFIGSVINRVMGITLSVVAWMMYSWLLFCYGGEEIWIACLDGLVSVGLLAAAGFLYGYVDGTIHALQIQVALAVLVQAISLAGAFELQVLLERGNAGDFVDSVSLRLVFGILCWIILLQWYRMNRTDESDFEEISGTEDVYKRQTFACDFTVHFGHCHPESHDFTVGRNAVVCFFGVSSF